MESENLEKNLKDFPEVDLEKKLEILQNISALLQKGQIQQNSNFSSKSLPNIIQILNQNLIDKEDELLISCTQTALDILKAFKREVEGLLTPLLPKLIVNLGHSHASLRKVSHTFLLFYIKSAKNFEAVIQNFLLHGFDNSNPQIRQKCVNSFQGLVISEFKSLNWESLNFKKLVENLLKKFSSEGSMIAKASEQALLSLIDQSEFNAFAQSLSEESKIYLKQLNEITASANQTGGIANDKRPIRNPINVNSNSVGSKASNTNFANVGQNIASNSVANGISFNNQKPEEKRLPAENDGEKVFGIFPRKVVDKIQEEDADWKEKSEGIEEIERALDKNYVVVNELLTPHLPGYVKFLAYMLGNSNFKISTTTLNIILKSIVLLPSLVQRNYLLILAGKLVEKLSDSKVTVRQLASKIIKELFKKSKENLGPAFWFDQVLNQMKSKNIYLKEEILALVLYFVREIDTLDQFSLLEKIITNTIICLAESAKSTSKDLCMEILVEISKRCCERTFKKIARKNIEISVYEAIYDRISTLSFNNRVRELFSEEESKKDTGSLSRKNSQIRTVVFSDRQSTSEPRLAKEKDELVIKKEPKEGTNKRTQLSALEKKHEIHNQTTNRTIRRSTGEAVLAGVGLKPSLIRIEDESKSVLKENLEHNKEAVSSSSQNSTEFSTRAHSKSSPSEKEPENYFPDSSKREPDGERLISDLLRPRESINKISQPILLPSKSRETIKRNQNSVIEEHAKEKKETEAVITDLKSLLEAQKNLDIKSEYFNSLNKKKPATKDSIEVTPELSSKRGNAEKSEANSGTPVSFSTPMKKPLESYSNSANTERREKDTPKSSGVISKVTIKKSDSQDKLKVNKKKPVSAVKDKSELSEKSEKSDKSEVNSLSGISEEPQQPLFSQGLLMPSKKKEPVVKAVTPVFHVEKEKPQFQKRIGSPKVVEKPVEKVPKRLTPKEKPSEKLNSSFREDEPQKSLAFKPAAKKKLETTGFKSNLDVSSQSYISKDALRPLENAKEELKRLLSEIKVDDWSKQFDALTKLRQINEFHIELLKEMSSAELHSLVTEVMKNIDSLRSSLAKNAMIAMMELLCTLKRSLDGEVELLLTRLIKKSMDTNNFISEEVKKCLATLCLNCSDNKILPTLLTFNGSKSAACKQSIALCIEAMIEKNEAKITQMRDFDKFLSMLANLICDGSQEVRQASKKALALMIANLGDSKEILKTLQKSVSESVLSKVKVFLEKEMSSFEGLSGSIASFLSGNSTAADEREQCEALLMKTDESSFKATKTTSRIGFNKTPNKVKDHPDFDFLVDHLALADAQDWRKRYQSVENLTDLGKKHPENLIRHKNLNKFLDTYYKLLNDSHNKVVTFAVSKFLEILPNIKPALESTLQNLFNAVFALVASSNPALKSCGDNLFDVLMDTFECYQIAPILANGSLFAVTKSKSAILNKMIAILPELHVKKPGTIEKYILTVIYKLLEDNKAETRSLLTQLTKTTYNLVGKALLEGASGEKKSEILKIIDD